MVINALMWEKLLKFDIAPPRLRTLHCLAKLLNDHLPIYEITHFFKWIGRSKLRKNALCCSVNVLSMKVLFDDSIFTFPYWRQDCHFTSSSGRATQRTSPLQSKGRTFISQCPVNVDPDSILAGPRGVETATHSLCSQAPYRLSQSSCVVLELALLKGNFRQEPQKFYRRACFLPSWSKLRYIFS